MEDSRAEDEFESRDERVLTGICYHKLREYWLRLQATDIERDLYKLKAGFAVDVN